MGCFSSESSIVRTRTFVEINKTCLSRDITSIDKIICRGCLFYYQKKRAKSVQRMVKIRTNGRRKLQHINFFSTNFCLRFRVLAYFDPIAPHWGRNFYKKQLKFI